MFDSISMSSALCSGVPVVVSFMIDLLPTEVSLPADPGAEVSTCFGMPDAFGEGEPEIGDLT